MTTLVFCRMNLFQNKTRDIILIVSGFLVLLALVFVLPSATKKAVDYKNKIDRSVVQVNLTPEQRAEFEKSIRSLQEEIARKDTKGAANHARQYIAIGTTYQNLGLLGKASDAYTLALKEDAQSTEALVLRADAQKEMGDFVKAEGDYRAAIDIKPTEPSFYHKFATFYLYSVKDEEKARGTYLDGLSRTKNSLELMKNFATFHELTGDKYQAYLYWEAVLKKEPKNAAAKERITYLKPFVQDVIKATDAVAPAPKKK
jgi:tetratricopeptide (TPR) repeat protein